MILHDILDEDIMFHVIHKMTCLPILATVIERIKYSCITIKFRDIIELRDLNLNIPYKENHK
jgi:hypothetical protein